MNRKYFQYKSKSRINCCCFQTKFCHSSKQDKWMRRKWLRINDDSFLLPVCLLALLSPSIVSRRNAFQPYPFRKPMSSKIVNHHSKGLQLAFKHQKGLNFGLFLLVWYDLSSVNTTKFLKKCQTNYKLFTLINYIIIHLLLQLIYSNEKKNYIN